MKKRTRELFIINKLYWSAQNWHAAMHDKDNHTKYILYIDRLMLIFELKTSKYSKNLKSIKFFFQHSPKELFGQMTKIIFDLKK